MRQILWGLVILTAGAVTACEAHDYWFIPEEIRVDADQGIYAGMSSDNLSQDLFVRYQLDYEVRNDSPDKVTEVVVSATSFVNSIERATGLKIWHLDPAQQAQGILMTSQLQLGNSIEVALECCSASRCYAKDVICPENIESNSVADLIERAEYCYSACKDSRECISQCPADAACTEYCEDKKDTAACRTESCREPGTVISCSLYCGDDEDCLKKCLPAPECEDECMSGRAACFKNCLAMWTQCSGTTYVPDKDIIPCSLCGGEGKCHANLVVSETEGRVIKDENGKSYTCNLDCNKYPSECIRGCEELFVYESLSMTCTEMCLRQHQFWCNDFTIPNDYIDTRYKQPCCYENFCQNTLTGVVKTYDVECFNNTDCASGSQCSEAGECVVTDASSCSAGRPAGSSAAVTAILFALLIAVRRKTEKSHAASR